MSNQDKMGDKIQQSTLSSAVGSAMNSRAKITPGPWRRCGGYMDGYGVVGDGKTVVKKVGDSSMDLDRHSADATLIAVAPRLFDALYNLLGLAYQLPAVQPGTWEFDAIEEARAVIAEIQID